jgi:hypothetical protein
LINILKTRTLTEEEKVNIATACEVKNPEKEKTNESKEFISTKTSKILMGMALAVAHIYFKI